MDLARFSNALRILRSIDGPELDRAAAFCEVGASLALHGARYRFSDDPVRFFLKADDQSQDAIWRIIEKRQPPQAACELGRRLDEDASRYRWLRTRNLDAIDNGGLFVGMVPENIVINGDDLDRCVDAARAAEREVTMFADAHDEAIEQERKGG